MQKELDNIIDLEIILKKRCKKQEIINLLNRFLPSDIFEENANFNFFSDYSLLGYMEISTPSPYDNHSKLQVISGEINIKTFSKIQKRSFELLLLSMALTLSKGLGTEVIIPNYITYNDNDVWLLIKDNQLYEGYFDDVNKFIIIENEEAYKLFITKHLA